MPLIHKSNPHYNPNHTTILVISLLNSLDTNLSLQGKDNKQH